MIIEKKYLVEAKKIIKDYNQTLEDIKVFEDILANNKSELLNIKNDIDIIADADDTDLSKRVKLEKIINNFELVIYKTQQKLQPYIVKLNDINKRSNVLYKTLFEKYPIPENELQKYLFEQLSSIED